MSLPTILSSHPFCFISQWNWVVYSRCQKRKTKKKQKLRVRAAPTSTPTQESPNTAASVWWRVLRNRRREIALHGPLLAPHLAPSLTHDTPCHRSICGVGGVSGQVAAGLLFCTARAMWSDLTKHREKWGTGSYTITVIEEGEERSFWRKVAFNKSQNRKKKKKKKSFSHLHFDWKHFVLYLLSCINKTNIKHFTQLCTNLIFLSGATFISRVQHL